MRHGMPTNFVTFVVQLFHSLAVTVCLCGVESCIDMASIGVFEIIGDICHIITGPLVCVIVMCEENELRNIPSLNVPTLPWRPPIWLEVWRSATKRDAHDNEENRMNKRVHLDTQMRQLSQRRLVC